MRSVPVFGYPGNVVPVDLRAIGATAPVCPACSGEADLHPDDRPEARAGREQALREENRSALNHHFETEIESLRAGRTRPGVAYVRLPLIHESGTEEALLLKVPDSPDGKRRMGECIRTWAVLLADDRRGVEIERYFFRLFVLNRTFVARANLLKVLFGGKNWRNHTKVPPEKLAGYLAQGIRWGVWRDEHRRQVEGHVVMGGLPALELDGPVGQESDETHVERTEDKRGTARRIDFEDDADRVSKRRTELQAFARSTRSRSLRLIATHLLEYGDKEKAIRRYNAKRRTHGGARALKRLNIEFRKWRARRSAATE